MITLSRRAGVRGFLVGSLLLLARCAGTTANQVALWAGTVANAALAAIRKAPPGTTTPPVVISGLQTVAGLAAQLQTAPGSSTGTVAQRLLLAASEVLPVAASWALGLGPAGIAISVALSAISALLPQIASATGNSPPAAAAPGSALAHLPPITVSQAVAKFGPK